MIFNVAGSNYETRVWRPGDGTVAAAIAIDTETEAIASGEIPRLVLTQAYGGGPTVYFVQNQSLGAFLHEHGQSQLIFHNAAFDLAVIEKASGVDLLSSARPGRIWDTGLLYRLWGLATAGIVPARWGLASAAKELLGIVLAKDQATRTGFGRYICDDGTVDYAAIETHELFYAALDVVTTWQVFQAVMPKVEALDPHTFLSHQIQLLGSIGLRAIEANGIGIDLGRRQILLDDLEGRSAEAKAALAKFGYVPGQKGVRAVGDFLLQEAEKALGVALPRTETTGMISTKADDLAPYAAQSPFIEEFLNFRGLEKLRQFVHGLDRSRVHASFNVLVNTGRTSCSGPNLQNQPRAPGVRECFVPAPDHCFLIIDYAQIELCTLAQVCIDRYGSSKMADLVNQGVDLHRWFAGVLLEKDSEAVSSSERQMAKACNFGFPGGLGIKAFLQYAREQYGITNLTETSAAEYRERWISAFPEMRRYLADDAVGRLTARFDFSEARETFGFELDEETAAKIVLRIAAGNLESKNGREYTEAMREWVFDRVLPALDPKLGGLKEGAVDVKRQVLRCAVRMRTGRIRASCSYTEARNTPFQGLAADGAKIALYRLTRAGYRVVNFIHDEFILEILGSLDLDTVGKDVERMVTESMRTVVPDVRVRAEWVFADRWYKGAKLVRNQFGRVVPYSEQSLVSQPPYGGGAAECHSGLGQHELPSLRHVNGSAVPNLDLGRTFHR